MTSATTYSSGGIILEEVEFTYDVFDRRIAKTVDFDGAGPNTAETTYTAYYYRARFYDPRLGRFISQDPLGFDGEDTNLYRYVANSPLIAHDPSGTIATLEKIITLSLETFVAAVCVHAELWAQDALDNPWQQANAFADALTQQLAGAAFGSSLVLNLTTRSLFVKTIGLALQAVSGAVSIYGLVDAALAAGRKPNGQLDLRLFWVRLACEGANFAAVPLAVGAARAFRNPVNQRAFVLFLKDDTGSARGVLTSPSRRIREWAQDGGFIDPKTNSWIAADDVLAAHHIYPQSYIKRLPGFAQLNSAQKDFLLNYPGNFEPLPKSWNSSMKNRLADEWASTPMGQKASPEYINALRERQNAFEGFATQLINFWHGQ